MTRRATLVPLVAGVFAAGAVSLVRPGYTPDEEFTLFAVRGITAHGFPLLPSGFLYDRGLLYSYASALAALVSGTELPAFRALSLLSTIGALVIAYEALRRHVSASAASAAVALAAASVPFWAAATSGRFYGPFLFTWVAALALAGQVTQERHQGAAFAGHAQLNSRTRVTWLALTATVAFCSRLTHELAFTLLAVPAAGLLLQAAHLRSRTDHAVGISPSAASSTGLAGPASPASLAGLAAGGSARTFHWQPWAAFGMALAIGLAAAQAVLVALHYVEPVNESGGGAMIQRFFLWQVLNLFERPQGAPLGVVLSMLLVSWLVAPTAAVRSLRIAVGAGTAVIAGALVYAAVTHQLDATTVGHTLAGSVHYPLDMFRHVAAADPFLIALALTLIVLRLCEMGGDWPVRERVPHLGWVGWMSWFGVIESGITTNYLVLPTVCLMAAIGIDLVAIAQHVRALRPGRTAQMARAALTGLALLAVADQWSGTGTLPERLAVARPTLTVPGIENVRDSLRPSDRVACTDELACLLLVGRVDAWLALHDYVRERFVILRSGKPVGVYAGAPAVFRPRDLLLPAAAPEGTGNIPRGRVIVVDVFKNHPVGHSSTWLPLALEADGLEARTLLHTPDVRVVEMVELAAISQAAVNQPRLAPAAR